MKTYHIRQNVDLICGMNEWIDIYIDQNLNLVKDRFKRLVKENPNTEICIIEKTEKVLESTVP